jgi:hypothetical protein
MFTHVLVLEWTYEYSFTIADQFAVLEYQE